jgi:tRNA pseudouridine55 synthase
VADGLLIIDKPAGPTSHDVVARMRRALRETRIGHTGTLDPMATGVLLLVVGKATRIARFLSASDKSYDAVVRFGFATDTADAQGHPLGPVSDRPTPSRDEIDVALDAFRGTFMQRPPAFSAKKIDGQRSYKLARDARLSRPRLQRSGESRRSAHDSLASEDPSHDAPRTSHPAPLNPPALPAPTSVTAHAIRVVSLDGDRVSLSLDCSAGFYVRSLAHDLGERLGVGAHLTALRRTRVAEFGLDRAVTLEVAERDPHAIGSSIVPLAGALPGLPAVVLTSEGASRISHGQDVRTIDHEPSRLGSPLDPASDGEARQSANGATAATVSHQPFVRLLTPSGDLLAIAKPVAGGLLHPSVVLV